MKLLFFFIRGFVNNKNFLTCYENTKFFSSIGFETYIFFGMFRCCWCACDYCDRIRTVHLNSVFVRSVNEIWETVSFSIMQLIQSLSDCHCLYSFFVLGVSSFTGKSMQFHSLRLPAWKLLYYWIVRNSLDEQLWAHLHFIFEKILWKKLLLLLYIQKKNSILCKWLLKWSYKLSSSIIQNQTVIHISESAVYCNNELCGIALQDIISDDMRPFSNGRYKIYLCFAYNHRTTIFNSVFNL